MRGLIPGFQLLSPVPEQSPTEPKTSLSAAPVSPTVKKDRPHRSTNSSSRSKKSFRTKEDVQSLRAKHEARVSARAQVKAAKEEDRKAKEAEALKEAQRKAEMATTPGQKRKRVSPDTIPNPKGCSFGMDLDYFGYDSSDEDEEPVTPSKQPNKIRRTSESEMNTLMIPRSRVFAKGDRERKEIEENGW